MKKRIVVFSLVILVSLVVISNVMAMPFIEVQGFVKPNAGNVIKNLETTTFEKIDYLIRVTDTDPGSVISYVKLQFEKDVFESPGSLSGLSHMWNTNEYSTDNNFVQETSAFANGSSWGVTTITGKMLGAGDELIFSMLNVNVFNDALTDPLCPGFFCVWNEGQIWAQQWDAAGDPLSVGSYIFTTASAGGSTTPTPEPGTFLLLGSGLVGVIVYVRKKKCLLNI